MKDHNKGWITEEHHYHSLNVPWKVLMSAVFVANILSVVFFYLIYVFTK